MSRRKTLVVYLVVALIALLACAAVFPALWRRPAAAILQRVKGRKTVNERVAEYGDAVRARLADEFAATGVSYPPERIVLVGLKDEKRLEVWVAEGKGAPHHLRTYPILAASGTLGPKLKEGDRQVPEGVYRIESLNPNSLFHLALRLNYPNEFDRAKGAADGREKLGSDIMIHGNNVSAGCLAMGDEAAEDLFVLAAETGIENTTVILSPIDFRTRDLPDDQPDMPAWTPELYDMIRAELAALRPKAP